MTRPWEDWDFTDDVQIARRRWSELTGSQRAEMAAETGIPATDFERHVAQLLELGGTP